MRPLPPLAISAMTTSAATGLGLASLREALRLERSGLQPAGQVQGVEAPGWVGRVPGLEQALLPEAWQAWDCRNNRLAWLALQQDGFVDAARSAVDRYGPERVGLFLGTSTSGIAATEEAYTQMQASAAPSLPPEYNYPTTHNMHSVGAFVGQALGLRGPGHTISTACSSSAKVFATASRALRAGLCDAAIVGGVDSLCLTTLFGFHGLQLVSSQPCRPADAERDGISIGEAAGFALLEKEATQPQGWLLGYGESSDAYHMSSPEPEGRGAMAAMQAALDRAGLEPESIDYINLHGTGTKANDAAEDAAVAGLFGSSTPCSSTKGFAGHTLGAAGIFEAVLSLLCLQEGWIPPSLNTRNLDPEMRAQIVLQGRKAPLKRVLSNSFGFGGTNCSLLLGAQA